MQGMEYFQFLFTLFLSTLGRPSISETNQIAFPFKVLSLETPLNINLNDGEFLSDSKNKESTNSWIQGSRVTYHGLPRVLNINKFFKKTSISVTLENDKTVFVCVHRNVSAPFLPFSSDCWKSFPPNSVQNFSNSIYKTWVMDVKSSSIANNQMHFRIIQDEDPHRKIYFFIGLLLLFISPIISHCKYFYLGTGTALGLIIIFLFLFYKAFKLAPGSDWLKSLTLISSMPLLSFMDWVEVSPLQFLPNLLLRFGVSDELIFPLLLFFLFLISILGAVGGFYLTKFLFFSENGKDVDKEMISVVNWIMHTLSWLLLYNSSQDKVMSISFTLFSTLMFQIRSIHIRNFIGIFIPSVRPLPTAFWSTYYRGSGRRKPKPLSSQDFKRSGQICTSYFLQELVSSPQFVRWTASNSSKYRASAPSKRHNGNRDFDEIQATAHMPTISRREMQIRSRSSLNFARMDDEMSDISD